jgi:hypothetical protein
LGVSQISKNDSSVSINDTGSSSTVTINIDGTTEHTVDADGVNLASGDRYAIAGNSVLNATTLGTSVVNSSLTTIGNLTSLSVASDATVYGNLTVHGLSTLNGGTLTLGDSDTDNVVFGADINSSIIPNTDATYHLGSSSKKWANVYATLGNIGTLEVIGNVTAANVNATNLTGTLLTASQPNITSVGNLTSLSASGIIETTGNVNATNLTGTLLTASQPNITAVGNLTSLSASGIIETTGNVTATNLTGTLLTASQPNITSVGNLTSLSASGIIETTGNVNASYVSGTLLTASQPNITSVGNLTSLSASGIIETTGTIYANSTATSTNTSTGALVIAGGTGIAGNLNVAGDTTLTGDLAVNGGDLTSTATTFNLLNNTTLNINAFGAATDINIGVNNAAARFGIKTPNIWFDNLANLETYSSSIKVFNASVTTTVNAFGAATTMILGATTGTANIRNATTNILGNAAILGTAVSTSTSTGALIVDGGAGVSGNLNIGGRVTVGSGSAAGIVTSKGSYDLTLTTNDTGASSPKITLVQSDDGNIQLDPSGTGVVTALSHLYVGNGSTEANISSLGTQNLVLSTNRDLGRATIKLSASTDGNIDFNLNGTGTINIPKITFGGGGTQSKAVIVGGDDSYIQYNNGGDLGGSANLTFNDVTNKITVGGAIVATTDDATALAIALG